MTWMKGEGSHHTIKAAPMATPPRKRSGHRDLDMPHTAWATTATAMTFSPCTTPELSHPAPLSAPSANRSRAAAEGIVNPSQAASAPSQPARCSPSAMPTWLLAGPGKNWHKATRSE